MRIVFATLTMTLFASCGAGMQTVCGVPFSDNGAGATVPAHSVYPAHGGSYRIVDENTWQLEQGGFSSAGDSACQFGVTAGHIHR